MFVQYTDKDIEQIKDYLQFSEGTWLLRLLRHVKMLQENRSGADKSQKVLESLISVRDQLKELKAQLSSLV